MQNHDTTQLTEARIDELVEETELIIGELTLILIDQKRNLRSCFKNKIYTVTHPLTGKEIEVILLNDFVEFANKVNS